MEAPPAKKKMTKSRRKMIGSTEKYAVNAAAHAADHRIFRIPVEPLTGGVGVMKGLAAFFISRVGNIFRIAHNVPDLIDTIQGNNLGFCCAPLLE